MKTVLCRPLEMRDTFLAEKGLPGCLGSCWEELVPKLRANGPRKPGGAGEFLAVEPWKRDRQTDSREGRLGLEPGRH